MLSCTAHVSACCSARVHMTVLSCLKAVSSRQQQLCEVLGEVMQCWDARISNLLHRSPAARQAMFLGQSVLLLGCMWSLCAIIMHQAERVHTVRKPARSAVARKESTTAVAHDGRVTGILPTPDGLHWLSAGTDNRLRLWDARHNYHLLVNYPQTFNSSMKVSLQLHAVIAQPLNPFCPGMSPEQVCV